MTKRPMLWGIYGLSFVLCFWSGNAGASGVCVTADTSFKVCPDGFTNDTETKECPPDQHYFACVPDGGGDAVSYATAREQARKAKTEKAAKEAKDKEAADARAESYKPNKGDDPCSAAMKAAELSNNGQAENFKCGTTNTVITAAKISNEVSQKAGSAIVQTLGQTNVATAQDKGTISASMNAAGETQVTSGKVQLGLGAANAVMGIYQLKLANDHGKKATSVMNLNEKDPGPAAAGTENKGYTALKERGRAQHNTMKDNAQVGAFTSIVTGAQQIAYGGIYISAGNKAKEEAAKMAAAEDNARQGGVLSGFNTNLGTTASAPHTTNSISDSEVAESEAATDEGTTDVPTADLGDGFSDGPNSDLGTTPTPGNFKLGGSPGSGGGGGGSIGGGSTSAASGGGDEGGGTRYAESIKSASGYDAGAGAMTSKGGGGSGNGGSSGPDLSGLLAQFLPKNEEESPKNGILDFGGASRDPASDGSFSVLDKNANIFQRISETYQDKHQRGYLSY